MSRARAPFDFAQGRLLTRMNYAGIRDDAFKKKYTARLRNHRFFFVHWSMRSRACCRFSNEFATLKRR